MNGIKCRIVGAGDFDIADFKPDENDYIIAADGGYKYLTDNEYIPDVLVGDFDSLKEIPEHPYIVRHPVMKDDTDMMLAVKLGLEKGYKEFCIYGALGGRLDHTVANLQLLSYITDKGAVGYITGGDISITLIKNSSVHFMAGMNGTVSVFAVDEKAEGVYERGLKYTLKNAVICNSIPIGVSNEFIGVESEITVENGKLLIMWTGIVENTEIKINGI